MLGRRRTGQKVTLIPRLPEHIETIYGWFDDPQFFPPTEPPSFPQYAERYEKLAEDRDVTLWSVVLGTDSPAFAFEPGGQEPELIGITELRDFTPDRGCLNSLLYIIPSARAQGYGTEAIQLRSSYAFETLDVELLETTTERENQAAQHALEGAGYRRTGERPHAFRSDGQWRDLYFYALLREWWESAREA